MAAIVHFEKTGEDAERVTYRYGADQGNLARSLTIEKANRRPLVDADKVTFNIELAMSGILRAYREQGDWPVRGSGVT